MTDTTAQNPFAPPRALVQDHFNSPGEMVTATRMSRFLAVLVDGSPFLVAFVIGIVMALTMMPAVFSGRFDPASLNIAAFGSLFLLGCIAWIAWAIWNIVLLYNYGQTVGKKVLGIRVVRMDGSRVTFARFFFLRGLATAAIIWVVSFVGMAVHLNFLGNVASFVGYLLIFGAARRCLHDYVADTKVVTAESSPDATLEGSRRL